MQASRCGGEDSGVRRIFVGDIQGCRAQLDALLRAVPLRPGDRLYCVGDLVNRGPDSLGVLRRLRELGALAVLGNHDLHLLRLAAGTVRARVGRRLRAILEAPDRQDVLDWLSAQPVMRVEDDLIVVHAGLHPAWTDAAALCGPLNDAVRAHVRGRPDARVTFVTEVRYCDAAGRRPPRDDPPPDLPYVPWDHFYRGARTVVFGHWARRGVVMQPRLRGLDSGCVYGHALTAWVAEEDRVVQVPGWRAT